MKRNKYRSIIAWGLVAGLGSVSISAYTADCTRDDVVFYLKQGFSHAEVAKMCSPSHANNEKKQPVVKQPSVATPIPTSAPVVTTAPETETTRLTKNIERNVYFRSSIKANSVKLTPTQLTYTNNKTCIKYGTDDGTGFYDQACVNTRTTIDLANLRVVSAKRALPFIGRPEFIVAANVQREIINPNILTAKQRAGLAEDYPLSLNEIEIPLRNNVDPQAFRAQLLAILP